MTLATSKIKTKATLREATESDYSEIERLKKEYNLTSFTQERWLELSKENPVIGRLGKHWPMGWVLEDQGKIVGHMGNVPLEYELEGERIFVATPSSWVVDKAYRSQSSELAVQLFDQSQVNLIIVSTAILPSQRAFERIGALRPPVRDYDVSLFWIVDYSMFARNYLQKKKKSLVVAPVLGLGLRLYDFLKKRNLTEEGELPIQEEMGFDADFDRFWIELKKRDRFLCVRDRETLKWHLDEALTQKKAWLYTSRVNGSIQAYSVFLRQDSREVDLHRLRLVDFQSVGGDPKVQLRGFLSKAYERAKSEGLHMLESVGFGEETRRVIESLHPHQRQLPSWMFVYRVKDAQLQKKLEDPSLWDPCFYDGDGVF